MYRLFEGPAKNQQDQNEWKAEQNDPPFANPTSCTNTSGKPYTGRGSKPMDMRIFVIADNHAGTQKANSGHNALGNTAGVSVINLPERENY